MAIEISKPGIVPRLVYDRVHMQNLQIEQRLAIDNLAAPVYELTIEYRLYAIDENNKRHYDNKVKIINIEDYLSEALEKAQKGKPELLNAMQAIEKALALILESKADIGQATVI